MSLRILARNSAQHIWSRMKSINIDKICNVWSKIEWYIFPKFSALVDYNLYSEHGGNSLYSVDLLNRERHRRVCGINGCNKINEKVSNIMFRKDTRITILKHLYYALGKDSSESITQTLKLALIPCCYL